MSESACPRCGHGFHCGAQEAHCPCFDLRLTPELRDHDVGLRDQLAQRFQGCLCLRCLVELAAGEPPQTPMSNS